ncbi:hypothetical protein FKP32DRAFT_1587291 [Trametes sanguinea]|nr:hypothetical protein FKP32DRAFT_1587291 [Trametes sanguinea]
MFFKPASLLAVCAFALATLSAVSAAPVPQDSTDCDQLAHRAVGPSPHVENCWL